MASKKLTVIASAAFVLALIAAAVIYVVMVKPTWLTGGKKAATTTPQTANSTTVLGASATPVPTPASDANTRDLQRKADLATYVAAYKATADNGFYPTSPASIPVAINDPATAQPYVIVKAEPTILGQIQYWAGGSCSGKSIIPGAAATHYLALQVLLENSATPYCLDVK